MRRLIINADDCNLTPGVTRGILKSHDEGILTSTTFLINLPLDTRTVREIKKRPKLGVGLHLNITLGRPVSAGRKIPSLLKPEGIFKRHSDNQKKLPSLKDVVSEYEAQIGLFEKYFGQQPDHLDTHHHLHDHIHFFQALALVAKRFNIPVRRSKIFHIKAYQSRAKNLQTTDYLFGNLEARSHWQLESFLGIVRNLPDGVSEIACHPGYCDENLQKISSFQEAREEELKVFASSPNLKHLLIQQGIELGRFRNL